MWSPCITGVMIRGSRENESGGAREKKSIFDFEVIQNLICSVEIPAEQAWSLSDHIGRQPTTRGYLLLGRVQSKRVC